MRFGPWISMLAAIAAMSPAQAGVIDIITEWRIGGDEFATVRSGTDWLWRGAPGTSGGLTPASLYGYGAGGRAISIFRTDGADLPGVDSLRVSTLWGDAFTLDGNGAAVGSMTVSGFLAGRAWADPAGNLLNSGPQGLTLTGLAGCPGGECRVDGPAAVTPNAGPEAPWIFNAAWTIPFSITVPVTTGESFMLRLAATAAYDRSVGSMSSASWAVVRSLDLPAGWTLTSTAALVQAVGPDGAARFGFAPTSVSEAGAAGLLGLGVLGLAARRLRASSRASA